MKKFILVTIIMMAFLVATGTQAHASCWVYTSADDAKNIDSIRYLADIYNKFEPGFADCDAFGTDAAKYNQSIQFVTQELKDPAKYPNLAAKNQIVLNSPLSLGNKSFTLILGNPKPVDGRVFLDARTKSLKQVFTCPAGAKGSVGLRTMIINTKGITSADMFAAASCLKDDGDVHVCAGTINEAVFNKTMQPGDAGWCSEDNPAPVQNTTPATIPPTCTVEVTPSPILAKQGTTVAFTVNVKKQNSSNVNITDNNELILIRDEQGRTLSNEGAINKDGSLDTNSELKLVKEALEYVAVADGKGSSTSEVGVFVSKTAKVETKKMTVNATSFYYADNYKGTGKGSLDFYSCSQEVSFKIDAIGPETICNDKHDNDGDGKVDCADPDCAGVAGCPATTETNCTDKIDNDADNRVDCDDTDCDKDKACNSNDKDGDGFPTPTDCNDNNAAVHPGAIEVCTDGIDNNCDGKTDAADPTCGNPNDKDGDGWLSNGGDCNDNDAKVNPGAKEICGDGIDNDCDTKADAFDTECTQPSGDLDLDGDTFTPNQGDCNDHNAAVNPNAKENCDGIDNNCDGVVDYANMDGDAYFSVCPSDCDDTNSRIYPKAPEVCGDGVDQDCDGKDKLCPGMCPDGSKQRTYYADVDGDTFGNPNATLQACSKPDGYVNDNRDCNDSNPLVNPNATEICEDSIDNNCDGQSDIGDPVCAGSVPPPEDDPFHIYGSSAVGGCSLNTMESDDYLTSLGLVFMSLVPVGLMFLVRRKIS